MPPSLIKQHSLELCWGLRKLLSLAGPIAYSQNLLEGAAVGNSFTGCLGNQNKPWMLMWGLLGTFGVAVVPSLKSL